MNLQIRNMRKSRGMTQTDLANAVGTTLRVVSSWERGETPIQLEDAVLVADLFGCTLDALAGRDFPSPLGVSQDERDLVDAYRACTPRERRAIMNTAQTMADDGNALNNPDFGAAEGVA